MTLGADGARRRPAHRRAAQPRVTLGQACAGRSRNLRPSCFRPAVRENRWLHRRRLGIGYRPESRNELETYAQPSQLDSADPRHPASPHGRNRTADHRLSRSLLASSGRDIHRVCQRARRRNYRARLVRVLSGDPNPDGPGVRFEDQSHRFDQSFAGTPAADPSGSYGVVERGPRAMRKQPAPGPCWCVPGVVHAGQVLLAEETGDASVALLIGANGATARITSGGATVEIATGAPMQTARWYRVWLAADPAGGRVLVGQQPLDGAPVTAEASASGTRLAVRRRSAVRGGECGGAEASFHRQAGGSRDPARLRRVLARCRCVAASASRRPAGRLGFFAWHRHARRSTTSVRRPATAGW